MKSGLSRDVEPDSAASDQDGRQNPPAAKRLFEDDGTNTFTQSCWCSGDIDADEMIGVNDLLLLLDAWGGYYHPDLDANNDAVFDVNDILAVVEAWGRICNDNS